MIFYYAISYYTILYYTILYYTILYYTILYYTILYYIQLYYTILYDTILYYTILYCFALRGSMQTYMCMWEKHKRVCLGWAVHGQVFRTLLEPWPVVSWFLHWLRISCSLLHLAFCVLSQSAVKSGLSEGCMTMLEFVSGKQWILINVFCGQHAASHWMGHPLYATFQIPLLWTV